MSMISYCASESDVTDQDCIKQANSLHFTLHLTCSLHTFGHTRTFHHLFVKEDRRDRNSKGLPRLFCLLFAWAAAEGPCDDNKEALSIWTFAYPRGILLAQH